MDLITIANYDVADLGAGYGPSDGSIGYAKKLRRFRNIKANRWGFLINYLRHINKRIIATSRLFVNTILDKLLINTGNNQ
jgi:hypothetical protein